MFGNNLKEDLTLWKHVWAITFETSSWKLLLNDLLTMERLDNYDFFPKKIVLNSVSNFVFRSFTLYLNILPNMQFAYLRIFAKLFSGGKIYSNLSAALPNKFHKYQIPNLCFWTIKFVAHLKYWNIYAHQTHQKHTYFVLCRLAKIFAHLIIKLINLCAGSSKNSRA